MFFLNLFNRCVKWQCKEGLTFFLTLTLLSIIGYSIWMFGGQPYGIRSVVLLFLLGSFLAFQIGNLREKKTLHPPPVPSLICLVIVAMGTVQCLFLPRTIAQFISPGVSEVWQSWIPSSLIDEASQASDAALSTRSSKLQWGSPLSVAPWFTRIALATPIGFGLAVWVASGMKWTIQGARGLCTVLTLFGCLLSFFGLADAITLSRDWQPELRARLWITPVGADSPFGTFVNSNNAAGFLLVALSAAIACYYLCPVKDLKSNLGGNWTRLSLLAIAVNVIGILGTQSRGASVALFAVGAIFLMQQRDRTNRHRIAIFLFLLCVAATALFNSIGTGETFSDRIQSVIDGRAMQNSRLNHWEDALSAGSQYFPMGSGLGTYRYAYLPYDQAGSSRWHVNADGMPVEWFVEGGLWLTLLLLGGVVWWFRTLHRIKQSLIERSASLTKDQEQLAFAVWKMMTFLIVSLLISQCFDFGILLPAVFMPVSVLVGLMTQISKPTQASHPTESIDQSSIFKKSNQKMATSFVASAALFVIGSSTLWDLRQAAWIKHVNKIFSANRRIEFDRWQSFEKELRQLEAFVAIWPRRTSSEHFMLLSSLRIGQQQYAGCRQLQEMVRANTIDKKIVQPKMLSLAVLRKSLIHHDTQESSLGPASLMLPGQNLEQYIKARKDALNALLQSPLDERARVRLIETDPFADQPMLSSRVLGQQAVQLRSGNQNLVGYLKTLLD